MEARALFECERLDRRLFDRLRGDDGAVVLDVDNPFVAERINYFQMLLDSVVKVRCLLFVEQDGGNVVHAHLLAGRREHGE